MKEIKFAVKKVKDEWRTVDEEKENNFTIEAKKGDEISWRAHRSDVSFQFSASPLFEQGNDNFTLKKGKSETRKVAQNAAEKEYEYAVFIHSDKVFARGESPPKIIIW